MASGARTARRRPASFITHLAVASGARARARTKRELTPACSARLPSSPAARPPAPASCTAPPTLDIWTREAAPDHALVRGAALARVLHGTPQQRRPRPGSIGRHRPCHTMLCTNPTAEVQRPFGALCESERQVRWGGQRLGAAVRRHPGRARATRPGSQAIPGPCPRLWGPGTEARSACSVWYKQTASTALSSRVGTLTVG